MTNRLRAGLAVAIAFFLLACTNPGKENYAQFEQYSNKESSVMKNYEHFSTEWKFSPVVRRGNLLFLSGMVGFKPDGRSIEESEEAQYRAAFRIIDEILEENGGSMESIVDLTTFHVPGADRKLFSAIKDNYISAPYPAWTAVTVHSLAFGALVEVKCIAVIDTPE